MHPTEPCRDETTPTLGGWTLTAPVGLCPLTYTRIHPTGPGARGPRGPWGMHPPGRGSRGKHPPDLPSPKVVGCTLQTPGDGARGATGEAPTDPPETEPPLAPCRGGDGAGRYRRGGAPSRSRGEQQAPRSPAKPPPRRTEADTGMGGGAGGGATIDPPSPPSAPPTHLGGAVEGEGGGPTPARPRGQPLPRRLFSPLRTAPHPARGAAGAAPTGGAGLPRGAARRGGQRPSPGRGGAAKPPPRGDPPDRPGGFPPSPTGRQGSAGPPLAPPSLPPCGAVTSGGAPGW